MNRIAFLNQFVWLLLINLLSINSVAQDRLHSSLKLDSNSYRGEGTEFEILLAGDVKEDDLPIKEDLELEVILRWNEKILWKNLIRTQNSRYQVWLPVGAHHFYAIQVSGKTSSGAAGKNWATLGNLQDAMRDGLDLQLSKPSRFIKVRTTYLGKPLPNAKVFVQGDRTEAIVTTDAMGETSIGLQPDSKSIQLLAWSESRKISPNIYVAEGDPTFDAIEHTVELVDCHSKVFEVMSADNVELPDIGVRVSGWNNGVGFGVPPTVELRTDAQGRFTHDWMPNNLKLDWRFVLDSNVWLPGKIDQTFEPAKIVPKKSKLRRTVKGRVETSEVDTAGLAVRCDSFQSQLENAIESAYALVDSKGNFSIDLLPEATYAAFVQDSRIVSKHQKVLLTDVLDSPVINLRAEVGLPVPILVTEGNPPSPLKGARVSVSSSLDVSWVEGGSPRGGSLARHVHGYTNSIGECLLYTLPGESKIGVSFGNWHSSSRSFISADSKQQFRFNQVRDKEVRGKVTGGKSNDQQNCQIYLKSIDGQTEEKRLVKTDVDGCFQCKVDSAALGALAISADQKLMGVTQAMNLKEEVVIPLEPTQSLRGKVVEAGEPVASRTIEARVVWKRNSSDGLRFNCRAITDAAGCYELSRLPCKAHLEVLLLREGGDAVESMLEQVYFEDSNDKRPELVSVLNEIDARPRQTVPQRFRLQLTSCRINNYRLVVVIANERSEFDKFLNFQLLDQEETPEIDGCMPLILRPDQLKQESTAQFAKQQLWPAIEGQEAFLAIYDGNGKELGRWHERESNKQGMERARTLLKSNVLPKSDAIAKRKEAFRAAQQSNRRVWLIISGRYCRPCFELSAWIEKHREVLAQEFVILKIDVNNSTNYDEISTSLEQGRAGGIPCHGIYAADGTLLLDSFGPLGNIGFPGSTEGLRHLKKMLEAGRIRLTNLEVEELLHSLE